MNEYNAVRQKLTALYRLLGETAVRVQEHDGGGDCCCTDAVVRHTALMAQFNAVVKSVQESLETVYEMSNFDAAHRAGAVELANAGVEQAINALTTATLRLQNQLDACQVTTSTADTNSTSTTDTSTTDTETADSIDGP